MTQFVAVGAEVSSDQSTRMLSPSHYWSGARHVRVLVKGIGFDDLFDEVITFRLEFCPVNVIRFL